MHTGLHALNWGLQRLALALAITVIGVVLAFVILVTVIVAGQAAAAFGQ